LSETVVEIACTCQRCSRPLLRSDFLQQTVAWK
jgi:hypothetical protein